jgi:glucose/arabinose dehydrogenase
MSKKNLLIATFLVIISSLGYFGYTFGLDYFALGPSNSLSGYQPVFLGDATSNDSVKIPKETFKEHDFSIEVLAENLFVPWSVVFTSSDRILISERNGSIREIQNGKLNNEPLITFPEVSSTGEEGLMGLTLDPDYEQNKAIYACLAYPKNGKLVDKVVRLVDSGTDLQLDTTIIDDIPAARFHAGCELGFGPDGKLYITTGDATNKQIAQQVDSLGGKILRLNSDGSIPDDNPTNTSIWSIGHRNPQGIAWHPETGALFSAEHGPSIFDGPAGGDEINIITKNGNYGWPKVSHQKSDPAFIDPLLVFTPAIAPGSITFYSGQYFPQLENDLLVAMLEGEGLLRIVFDPDQQNEVLFYHQLPGIEVGRVRDVTVGPNGFIYFTTSNRDGRAEARPNDDKLYRIVPTTQ